MDYGGGDLCDHIEKAAAFIKAEQKFLPQYGYMWAIARSRPSRRIENPFLKFRGLTAPFSVLICSILS
jgi:hypothetical protein